jgi:hypothetical protein
LSTGIWTHRGWPTCWEDIINKNIAHRITLHLFSKSWKKHQRKCTHLTTGFGCGKVRHKARIWRSMTTCDPFLWITSYEATPWAQANSPVPPMMAHSPFDPVGSRYFPINWMLEPLYLIWKWM